jgi:hypothetical protein
MFEVVRFLIWTVVVVFLCDFVYAAFHQGRHLNSALKWRPRKRGK